MSTAYQIVLADPPWLYPARLNAKTKFGKGMHRYPGMTTEKICNYLRDINLQLDQNACLFMWALWPTRASLKSETDLRDAFRVMEAWGFRYTTCAFVWVKMTAAGNPRRGPGYYTASNTEPCLLSVRGRPPIKSLACGQVILAPLGPHSRKPAETRERILQLCGDRPRIELFATEQIAGWDRI
jgi:site-specific DNA-methyltransferase (adenine-specific)